MGEITHSVNYHSDQRFDYYKKNVDFIQRYIFPGGFLPSINILSSHTSRHTNLVMESLDDIGFIMLKRSLTGVLTF